MYATITRKEMFSNQSKNCQKNVLDPEDSLLMSSRPLGQPQKSQTTEHRTSVLRYEQLTTAGGPQVLPTIEQIFVWGVDAAVHHVLLCLMLQTLMNRVTQLEQHPLKNSPLLIVCCFRDGVICILLLATIWLYTCKRLVKVKILFICLVNYAIGESLADMPY